MVHIYLQRCTYKFDKMSNIKNAESFAKLVDFCSGYGGIYNPGRPSLHVDALIVLREQVKNTLSNVISAKSLYDNRVNQRKQVFDELPKLVSGVLHTLEASGASAEKIKDARAYAHQITGYKNKTREAVPEVTAIVPPEEPKTNSRSNLQLAYVSKADGFAKLVDTVSTEPLYITNEAAFNKQGLMNKLNELITLNHDVSQARVQWSNHLIGRNDAMYHQMQSMCNTGRAVKKYVRAIFGYNSEQYAQIKGLKFTKPVK